MINNTFFSDGIVSFPFGHPLLSDIRKFKKEIADKMQKVIRDKKHEMLKKPHLTVKEFVF